MVWSGQVSYSSAAPHCSKYKLLLMQISSSGNLQNSPLLHFRIQDHPRNCNKTLHRDTKLHSTYLHCPFFPIFLSLCEILSPLRAPTASLGFDSPYLSLHSWMKASLGRRWCPDQKKAEFLSSNFYPSPKKIGIFGSIKALQIYVGFVTSAEKIKVISLQVLTHFQTKINKLISINTKILQAL